MKNWIRSKKKQQGAVKLAGALGLLLALSLIVALTPTPAAAVQQLPHGLWGNATVEPCGIEVPEGSPILAMIWDPNVGDWVDFGYCEVDDTPITPQVGAGGQYGYPPQEFTVLGDDPTTLNVKEGGNDGETINFFIQGTDPLGNPVTLPAGTAIFESGWTGIGPTHDPLDLEVEDNTDPFGTIEINGGDACTNNPDVTLTLTWEDGSLGCGVDEMHFSNDDIDWSDPWKPVAATSPWTLSEDDGVKMVYVEFKDFAGNLSTSDYTISDDITLDTTDPVVVITAPADEGCYTTADTPALAYDVTEVNIDTVVEEGYSTLEGEHTVTVTVTDCADNVGSNSVTYIVDNTNPVIDITGVSDGVVYNTDVTPVITITDVNLISSSITLNGEPFVSGTTITEDGAYTLVAIAEDCAGNTTEVTVGFTITTTALLINEFVSDPGLVEGVEWIELYNPGAETVDLTDWTIEDGTATPEALDGLSVPASGYLVLLQGTDFTFTLDDAGDTIILKDDTATEVDKVAYGTWDDGITADNAPAPGEDESTGRCPNGSDTDVDNVDFIVFTTPTPGAANLAEPAVTTLAASGITDVSATLNGNLDSLGCPPPVDVSFVWGTTSGDLDQETPSQAMDATGPFSAPIDGLFPDTRYYFQAKADGGTVYGDELWFDTLEGPLPEAPMYIDLALDWNTFSVPLSIDPANNTLGDLATLGGLNINQAWYLYNDGVTTAWLQAPGTYEMHPCDAVYLEMNAAGTVPIYPHPGPEIIVSSKYLYAGWNLAGSAFLNVTGELPVDEALITIYYAPGDLMPWGYTQVLSPGYNQPDWTYTRQPFDNGETPPNMLVGKGYLVTMENSDEYQGQTQTPYFGPWPVP